MGIPFERLTKIIISHQDIDHIGCLRVITDLLPDVEVYAPAIEMGCINGEKPFLRSIESTVAKAQDEELKYFQRPLTAAVHHTMEDGDVLPFCGGIQIIATPGHSPGHLSFLHVPSKTLLTNDALAYMFGKVVLPYNILDQDAAVASIKKLAKLDFDRILFYHGGLFSENAKEMVEQFIGEL